MNTLNSLFTSLLFVAILSACAPHTDAEYDKHISDNTVMVISEIVETNMTPLSSRAGDAMSLRFIMEAWKMDESHQTYSVLAIRREQLADETDMAASFIFDLPETGDYRLLFFADYIDKTSTGNQGFFADK